MVENGFKDKKWLNATFLTALKNGVAAGDFVKNKNSYKLSADFKKKAAKKAAPAKKKASAKKKAPAKKKTANPLQIRRSAMPTSPI